MKSKALFSLIVMLVVFVVWGIGLVVPSWKMAGEEPFRHASGMFFTQTQNSVSREGGRIYGQLGCAACHSQHAVMDNGSPEQWYQGGRSTEGKVFRLTLPDDYAGDYTAHFGKGTRAPEFSSLPHRIGEKLVIQDAGGNEVRYGTVREWLMLHLYNPADETFGHKGLACPPLPFLFEEVPADSARALVSALPVKSPQGKKIVPTSKADKLVDYLLSLDKHAPLAGNMLAKRKSFIPSGRKTLDFDSGAGRGGGSEEDNLRKEGSRVFFAQCAVCHGRDGTGDGFNYPPLAGSEWLDLPLETLYEIVLRGVKGPLMVKGREWDNYMTPQGDRLNDSQIAAVIDYILRTFNPGREIKPDFDMVKPVRDRAKGLKPLNSGELTEKLRENG